MTNVLKPGYARLCLEVDVPKEDARASGLLGRNAGVDEALEVFRTNTGAVEMSVSFVEVHKGGSQRTGSKTAVHIVSPRKEGEGQ
tara:strand:+ start:149 stop:403 length:255 start_codon:yes stop_codon:yes gene_type:complete